MAKQKKQALQSVLTGLVVLIVLLVLILAGACTYLFTRYTWVAGGFREKGSTWLDLRGEDLSLAGYQALTEAFPDCDILWNVPLRGELVASDSAAVTVCDLTEADWKTLELFPNLTELNAAGCRDYDALLDFGDRHPNCRVYYTVSIGAQEYPNDAQSITVSDADAAELERLLPYLPDLTQLELTGQIPDGEAMNRLIAAFPGIFFRWPVTLGDMTVDSAAMELDLQGRAVDFDEICRLMEIMPNLNRVNLLGCPLTDEQVLRLAGTYPDCQFLWELQIGDGTFRTDLEELDVSGWQVERSSQIEDLLPCFFNLNRVIMCGCGLDDETMDALNRRYEDIRFVWSVRIKDVDIRTDAKWFYPYKYQHDMVVGEEDLYPLRYCTDMEAIDIGHMTTVKTCEWAAYMPNLKYLILVETAITDISPLANLKNLVFLEIFTTKITDYSPLLGCTALEDLNLGQTYGDPGPILQMTWLKNLWWSGIEGTQGLPCSDAPQRLREALPNTTMKFNLETPNVNNGWRQLDNYYAMRDLMDVFYLS